MTDTVQGLGAADFSVPDAAITAVLDRNVRREFTLGDPEWQAEMLKAIGNRRLGIRRWLRRMLLGHGNAREQLDVRSGYEQHWENLAKVEDYVAGLNDRTLVVRWRERGMILAPQALRQSHLLYLMKAILAVRPRRVVEVGCGNGNIILTLAARFPEVEFAGVELTESGVMAARAVQAQDQLPESFVASSPEPLADLTAHRRIDLWVGDASALPFPDRSFDLVYTRIALEQMEQLRKQALREITRVSAKAVVLIEPWRDFNQTGVGRAYVRRMGYFAGRAADLKKYGFAPVLVTDDLPQKVQFSAGTVVALRR